MAVLCVCGQIIVAQPRCLTWRPSQADNTTFKHLMEYQVRASMPPAALAGYALARFARFILSSFPAEYQQNKYSTQLPQKVNLKSEYSLCYLSTVLQQHQTPPH